MGEQPLPQAMPGKDTSRRYPLRLVRCGRCTLVQLDYIVLEKERFPADYPYITGNTGALRDHFAEQARAVSDLVMPGDLVIDIGGNDGTMLRALRKIDPEPRLMLIEPTDQAKRCDDTSIKVVQAYFTDRLAAEIAEEHGVAKVITASNVFGHVGDPHDFLDGVEELLAPDGTLIIDNQDWHNVVQDLQIDTIYHEHLRYFSPASLSWLLAQHGLLVVSWNRIGMHGGSFRVVARWEKADLEERAGYLALALNKILERAAEDGPVYAVTAPTRATPLINYANIARYLTCACEIAGSEKIGAVIPGTDVPIVDEERLFTDQPPHALILAWDIAGGLIPVLRKRGYTGTFIVPLPEPRIVRD
jgi:spermidine synthase